MKPFKPNVRETMKKKTTAKKPTARKSKKPDQVCIEIGEGVCGLNIYLNGYRIVGEKPWGGGRIIRRWLVSEEDIKTAMSGFRMDPKDVQLI